jgi:hypothetical protein
VTVGGEEICYQYGETSNPGDWIKEVDEGGNGGRMRDSLNTHFLPFASMFDSFTYDEENKQYVAESVTATVVGQTYTYTNVCIRIEDGALVEITFDWKVTGTGTGTEMEMEMYFRICDFGSTSVTLPTIRYTASAEEWQSLMTSGILDNVRVDVEVKTVEGQFVTNDQWSFAENAKYVGEGIYLVKEEGVWYKVTRDFDMDKYVGVSCESIDDYTLRGTIFADLANKYSLFEYDEQEHCYVATNVTAMGVQYSELKVYIRNGYVVGLEHTDEEMLEGTPTVLVTTMEFGNYGGVEDDDILFNIEGYILQK